MWSFIFHNFYYFGCFRYSYWFSQYVTGYQLIFVSRKRTFSCKVFRIKISSKYLTLISYLITKTQVQSYLFLCSSCNVSYLFLCSSYKIEEQPYNHQYTKYMSICVHMSNICQGT